MSDSIVVLNHGLVQQEGSPEEVYNYPVNHFVADFLGHSNFFKAVVERRNNASFTVRVDDGNRVVVEHPGDWIEGQPVELVVRAQRLDIFRREDKPPESPVNLFDGKIKDRSYMGGEVSYFVELENGTVIHVIKIATLHPFRRGENISIRISPRDCGLLNRE
jgi:ABC-type Fe3+/spermidine/putrescine transport system ATPase subunit